VVAKRVGLSATQLKTIQTTFETAIRKAAEIQDKAIEAAVKDLKAKKPKTEKEAKDLMDEANNRAEAAHRKVEPQITKLRKDAEAKVLATLTAQQKAAWEALKGKKFTPPAGS
jgi:membrane protein involved in colicin uptake